MQTSSAGIKNSLCEHLFKLQPKLLQATSAFLNSKNWSLLKCWSREWALVGDCMHGQTLEGGVIKNS